MPDLTTLAAVKAYLAITTSNQDALIASLIPRESGLIESWTGRRFPGIAHTLRRLNGSGTQSLTLPDSPILSISFLSIDGVEVEASADGLAAGYTHDTTQVYLVGLQRFPNRPQSVVCSWIAGYQENETAFVPTGNTPTLTPSNGGRAVENLSVTAVATELELTEVGAAPVAGQYTFVDGVYTFNASNSGDQVTMAYRYVPGQIEQACIEMVGLDLKQRDNLGITSKSLANETISYTDKGMTASVKELLQPFRKMVPA